MGKFIHISVRDKVALYSARDGAIICGNDDYQVQFALDPEWDDVPAKARFIWNGRHQDVPIVGGLAVVPRISNAYEVQVGVYSDDGSMSTTTPARVPCEKSILCGDSAPTEGNEAYYASEAQEAADRAEAAADRAEAAGGNGGTGGGVVIDPESVNQAQEAADRAEAAADRAEAAADRAEGVNTTAIEPAASDLPRIFFTGHFPSSKLESDGSAVMEYISKTKRFKAYVSVKVQGSSSTTFAKKNYTFKLFSDEAHSDNAKLKVAFRDWPAKNKFVAKANTIDRTHARNVVSARIWGDMVKSRDGYADLPAELRNSPNQGAIDGFPVKIYLNGVYQGLYTWNIPKDDWMAGMDEDNANHMIICAEGSTKRDGDVVVQNGNAQITFNEAYTDLSHILNGWDWEVEVGKKNDTIRDNFKAFSDLVVRGSDDDFKANLHNYLDIESFIDNYIFVWLACGVDSLGKNQFLYTYEAGLPWYSGVYDLDSTWGLHPEGKLTFAYNTVMPDGYIANNNRLYARFRTLFMDDIRTRWNKVKHGALSMANIINHFEAFHDAIPVELFAEDSADTTANGEFVTSGAYKGFDKVTADHTVSNIQQIRNFAAARWAYVDAQINYIECTSISLSPDALTFNEAGQAELTAILNEGCNEAIVWTSDNHEVATVGANGYGKATVTAIYNGSCTITATCGAYSATCTVYVSGLEEAMSTNLAGATGKGEDLTFGSYDNRGEITEMDNALHTKLLEFTPGDVYYVYGYEPRYLTAVAEVPYYTEDGVYIKYSSTGTSARPLTIEGDSDGPSRTVNGKIVQCYKVTLPNITQIDNMIIAKFRFNGRTTFDSGVTYSSVTGGVYIIQRNEPITEETLQEYEAMVAASAEA